MVNKLISQLNNIIAEKNDKLIQLESCEDLNSILHIQEFISSANIKMDNMMLEISECLRLKKLNSILNEK